MTRKSLRDHEISPATYPIEVCVRLPGPNGAVAAAIGFNLFGVVFRISSRRA